MRSLVAGGLVALLLTSAGLSVAGAGQPTTTVDTTPTTVATTPTTVATTPTTVATGPEPTPAPTDPTTPPNTPPSPRPTVPRTPNSTAFRPPTASTTPDETTTTIADESSTTSTTDSTVATSTTERLAAVPVFTATTATTSGPLPTFAPDTSPASSSRAVSIAIIAVLGLMATAVAVASRRNPEETSANGGALADAVAATNDGAVGDAAVDGARIEDPPRPLAERRDDVRNAAVSGSFATWSSATKALASETPAVAASPAFAPPMLAGPAWVIPAEQAARTAALEARANAESDAMADAPGLPQRGLPPMVQARAREDAPQVAALVELARSKQDGARRAGPDAS